MIRKKDTHTKGGNFIKIVCLPSEKGLLLKEKISSQREQILSS